MSNLLLDESACLDPTGAFGSFLIHNRLGKISTHRGAFSFAQNNSI